MSTTISRTWYNTLIDDDGSGTTGSIWDKADVDAILDAIDALIAADITFGGLVSTQGMGLHQFGANADLAQGIAIHNPSLGANASVEVRLGNANEGTAGRIVVGGATNTALAAPFGPDLLTLACSRVGVQIAATGASGSVRMFTGAAERWRVENDGVLYGMTAVNRIAGTGAASRLTLAGGAPGSSIELVGGTAGATTFTSGAEVAWNFNCLHANGGVFQTSANGVATVYIGSKRSILGTGSPLDGIVYGNAALYLEGAAIFSTAIGGVGNANPANMYIDPSTFRLYRSTSSLRYKTDVAPLRDWRWLLELQPITFTSVTDPEGPRHGGLAAEDVAAHGPRDHAGRPLFAGLNAQGEPEDVAYTHLVAPLVAAVQELERRLAAVEGS